MEEAELKKFINDIESASIKISLEEIQSDEEIRVFALEDLPCPGALEIEKTLDCMNIYCYFYYNDCSYEDRTSSEYYNEIEEAVFTFYRQKDLEHALKQLPYPLSVWDDGCFGCPGTGVQVGFRKVPCNVDIIKQFIEKAICVFEEQSYSDLSSLLNKKLDDAFLSEGRARDRAPFQIEIRNDIDYKPFPDNETLIYVGEEYVLFKNTVSSGTIFKNHYNLFNKIVSEIEYFTDIYYVLDDKYLQAFSASFCAKIPLINFNAVDIEVAFMGLHLNELKPFLTGENLQQLAQQGLNIDVDGLSDIEQYLMPHIYTEGHTDWKHIKHAFSTICPDFLKTIAFEEYPGDENLGDTNLLNKCEVYAKGKNSNARIMIFDRDNMSIMAKIEENEKGFKDWGNRVYSFALPVPEHRKSTPAISIEHYYSDAEIMSEIEVAGVKRRLYLRKEFDDIGRSPGLGKICKNIKKSSKNSIAIIDDGVYDSNSNSTINYALSKSAFADEIQKSVLSDEAKRAFSNLLQKILAILNYDKVKRNKNV